MATIRRIDDRDPTVTLSSQSDFSQGGNGNEYMSTTTRTNRVGASIQITFTGTQIAIYGTIDSTALGTAPRSLFSIDGGRGQQFVESQVDHSQYQQRFYLSPNLTPGQHTLLITVSDVPSVTASFTFDYADIWAIDTPANTPTPTPENTPPATSATPPAQQQQQQQQQTTSSSTSAQQQQTRIETLTETLVQPPLSTSSSSASASSSSNASGVLATPTNSAADSSTTAPIPSSILTGNDSDGSGLANSLDSHGTHPSSTSTSKSSTPAIVGGIVGALVVILVILAIVFFCLRKRRRDAIEGKWNSRAVEKYSDAPATSADTSVRPLVASPLTPSTFIQYPSTLPSEFVGSNHSEYSSSASASGRTGPTTSSERGSMIFLPGAVPATHGHYTSKAAEAAHHRRDPLADRGLDQPPPQYEV
ncbi:hypothetical protein D9613_006317 [Agrocybe pediades]|uniref:Uncharacterized protein n=1 Tax=Agrocybe pediades TaxID=84607 RepID=A0A8H4VRH9_9AGAR|nr:hypothetical protein D9613_006317 [Agrocybe pediades]